MSQWDKFEASFQEEKEKIAQREDSFVEKEKEALQKEEVSLWKRWQKPYRRMQSTKTGNFFITLAKKYDRNHISALAAESTYYLILSIVPFFIFFLNTILFFASRELPKVLQLIQVLPIQTQEYLKVIITHLLATRSETILSVGILVAFWATARGVQGLIRALNIILNAHGHHDNIILIYVKAVVFTLLWTFNAVASLTVMVYGDAIFHFLANIFLFPKEVIMVWRHFVYWTPFWVIMMTLSVFYRYAPRFTEETRLSWKKSFFSGLVGSVFWLLVTFIYRYYIGHIGDLSLTYGPLVGLMALFIWINLSVRAVLLGAEVTATLEDIGVFSQRISRYKQKE